MFEIKKRDVIAITGAGGKTSLLNYLSEDLRGRKVITTSTKIYRPDNVMVILNESFTFKEEDESIVTAKEQRNNKLIGINDYAIYSDFDYYIYEADGSKGYPLKGWRENEPVIINNTTKTIGVLDITVIDKEPKEVVFRPEELSKITKLDDKIKEENLSDIINHKYGLFKNSYGKKILFINKVESKYHENKAIEIIEQSHVDLAVIGSIKNKEFKTIKP